MSEKQPLCYPDTEMQHVYVGASDHCVPSQICSSPFLSRLWKTKNLHCLMCVESQAMSQIISKVII